jgi:hypothetical protein
MDFAQAREMVRLRHELRHLLVERRSEEARAVLVRLAELAEADAAEAEVIRPEIARWQTRLALAE